MNRPWRNARRHVARLVLVWLAAGLSHAAQAAAYRIDQRHGTIGFSVDVAGLFAVAGKFPRFIGDLLLDLERPDKSRIDVTIDAAAVEMPLDDQTALLRSDAYFNTTAHPTNRFVSTAIEVLTPTRYAIHGLLSIRGVTLAQVLNAEVLNRHMDQTRQVEVADLLVAGRLSRAAFGMVADKSMISDAVALDIRVRLELPVGPAGR